MISFFRVTATLSLLPHFLDLLNPLILLLMMQTLQVIVALIKAEGSGGGCLGAGFKG